MRYLSCGRYVWPTTLSCIFQTRLCLFFRQPTHTLRGAGLKMHHVTLLIRNTLRGLIIEYREEECPFAFCTPLSPTMTSATAPPMTHLTGTGGPDYFRTLNLTGWQKDWTSSTPMYGNHPHVVANDVPNPVLLTGLKPGVTQDEVEAAVQPFGEVRCAAAWAFSPPAPAPPLTSAALRRSWPRSSCQRTRPSPLCASGASPTPSSAPSA